MAEPFYKSIHLGAWAQPNGPNTTMHYLGCVGLEDIAEGGGDINTLFRCYTANGKWVTRGATRNLPEPISTTVTELLPKTASWLETVKQGADCAFPFYLNVKSCPPNDVFAGADRWWTLEKTYIGPATLGSLLSMDEELAPTVAFALSAEPGMIWGHAITTDRIATFTGTENLNDITSCSTPRCQGDCGDAVAACDTLVAVADADPASADVWLSFDNGATWTAAAVDPYVGTTTDLKSVVCFAIDSDTTRILVAQEANDGDPAYVYYSDDWGATWTAVVLTTPGGYGAVWGGALFALDMYHVWIVVTNGTDSEIHFSDDGGATWTEQAAITGHVLYAVHFADADDGMVVGTTDDVYTSTDGGATWGAATATGGGDTNYCVTENTDGIWWIGTNAGEIWYSSDHGVTWARRDFPGDSAGAVYDIDFVTPTVGFMVHSPTAATGRLYRTRDGGMTWELASATVAGELYSVIGCTVNDAFAVGEVDTTALVLKAHD